MDKFNRSINNKKVTGGLILCLVVISGIGVYALTKPKTKPKEEKIEEVAKEDVKEEVTEKQETPVVNDNKENKETTSKSSNSSNSNQASNSKPSISNKTTKSTPGNTTSNTQAKPNHNVSKPATQKPNPSKSKPNNPKLTKPNVVTPNAIYDLMKPGDYISPNQLPKGVYKLFSTYSEAKVYGEKMMDLGRWSGYTCLESLRNNGNSVWIVEPR